MNRLLAIFAVAVALCLCTLTVQAYPKPNIAKVAWELDFEHGTPTRITYKAAGDESPKAYWYMTFTVTNNSKDDQLFLPIFEMIDDKGNLHRSDKNVPDEVFAAIKKREAKRLMQPLAKVTGKIRQGVDQAVDSVAIWEEPIERMGTFSIFVTGLSGEIVWYKDGKATEPRDMKWHEGKVKPENAGEILRKTLQIETQVPGDGVYQGNDKIIQKSETWIMR